MPRPGAFAANFRPEVLDRFRELCRRQGRQYTKVLERLAEVYLETEGAVLDGAVSAGPADPDRTSLEELKETTILPLDYI